MGKILFSGFWMNGFQGVYSWWADYANTSICIYSGLTRADNYSGIFPFLSQFMLIQVFVPIYVNSSVGISWDDSRHSLKHGQPDERSNLDENNYEFVLDTSPIDLTSTPWLNAMEDGMQMIKYVLVHIRHFCNKKPSHRLEHLFELIPCVEPICNCL